MPFLFDSENLIIKSKKSWSCACCDPLPDTLPHPPIPPHQAGCNWQKHKPEDQNEQMKSKYLLFLMFLIGCFFFIITYIAKAKKEKNTLSNDM